MVQCAATKLIRMILRVAFEPTHCAWSSKRDLPISVFAFDGRYSGGTLYASCASTLGNRCWRIAMFHREQGHAAAIIYATLPSAAIFRS
jgi:hypothetical protein